MNKNEFKKTKPNHQKHFNQMMGITSDKPNEQNLEKLFVEIEKSSPYIKKIIYQDATDENIKPLKDFGLGDLWRCRNHYRNEHGITKFLHISINMDTGNISLQESEICTKHVLEAMALFQIEHFQHITGVSIMVYNVFHNTSPWCLHYNELDIAIQKHINRKLYKQQQESLKIIEELKKEMLSKTDQLATHIIELSK